MKYSDACDFIVKTLKLEMTGEEFFNAHPRGELYHVFIGWEQARALDPEGARKLEGDGSHDTNS